MLTNGTEAVGRTRPADMPTGRRTTFPNNFPCWRNSTHGRTGPSGVVVVLRAQGEVVKRGRKRDGAKRVDGIEMEIDWLRNRMTRDTRSAVDH